MRGASCYRRQAVFANRIHWAKRYLVQAGLLEVTRRAHFRITPRGSEVLTRHPDRVDANSSCIFPSSGSSGRALGTAAWSLSRRCYRLKIWRLQRPPRNASRLLIPRSRRLRATILERISKGTPRFFEKVVVDLLTGIGYGGSRTNAGRRVGKTADGGIDGVINEDPLGLDFVYLQAKRYAPGNTVGVDKVRVFAGSLVERGATKGVFVTTSQFAPAAITYADRIPQRLILMTARS
jgi:restriction system protein